MNNKLSINFRNKLNVSINGNLKFKQQFDIKITPKLDGMEDTYVRNGLICCNNKEYEKAFNFYLQQVYS